MCDSADFTNNPFAALARKLNADAKANEGVDGAASSPRKQDRGATHPRHALRTYTKKQEESDDSVLFLQAVQQVSPAVRHPNPPERHTGWRMEEAVELPSMSKTAKGNKKSGGLPSATPMAPAAEPCPTPQKLKAGAHALHVLTDIAHGDEAASADEQAFFRAMREVQPLSGKGREVAPEVEPAVNFEQTSSALQDFLDGKLEFALALTGEYLEGYVVGLDEVTMNKLRAGQYSPEAHLDLHGLNALQAYQALVGFFRSAWYKGMRTVLVVPGRGRNSHDGFGVLRDKVQSWLTQEPFKRVVLAFCTARPVDGGPGSVYVLLRKYRKKGKIYWERTPVDPDLF